jgi:hypothetical protein
MIMFLTPKIPRNLQWVVDSVEERKKQKDMYYIFMEIHMANNKYLTMAFTHKTSLPSPKLAFPIET